MVLTLARIGPLLCLLAMGAPVSAEWSAATPEVAATATAPEIASVLEAVDILDQSLIDDDHEAFSSLLAEHLAVNNPQNAISMQGATARLAASGRISYSRYDRIIEYAGLRNGMVLLMGEEIVVPKGAGADAAPVHRRFTDLWQLVEGRWLLSARQATIIAR